MTQDTLINMPALARAGVLLLGRDFLTHIQLISTKTDLRIMRPALEKGSPRGCSHRGSPVRSQGRVSAEITPDRPTPAPVGGHHEGLGRGA